MVIVCVKILIRKGSYHGYWLVASTILLVITFKNNIVMMISIYIYVYGTVYILEMAYRTFWLSLIFYFYYQLFKK